MTVARTVRERCLIRVLHRLDCVRPDKVASSVVWIVTRWQTRNRGWG